MRAKAPAKETSLDSRIELRLRERELRFCKHMAKFSKIGTPQDYIRGLINSAMSPEVKPKFEENFQTIEQKLDRLIRKSNQFESAFKELLLSKAALQGFIVGDVNARDKPTLKTISQIIDKSIADQKEMLTILFKPTPERQSRQEEE